MCRGFEGEATAALELNSTQSIQSNSLQKTAPRAVNVSGRYRKVAAQANWRCTSCPHLQPRDAPSLLPRPGDVPRARRNTSCCVMPGRVDVWCAAAPECPFRSGCPLSLRGDFTRLQPLFLQPVTFSRVRAVPRQRDESQSQRAPDNYSNTNTNTT